MAATRKPRKPKLKKMPNKPKAKASLDVHKKYDERAAKVKKENDKKLSEYNKDLKAWESEQKTKEKIRNKY